MAQISSAPPPMLPYTLGQIAVRSGSLPDGMLRPGQVIQMQAMQSASAGEQVQVKIAGRTLQAVLPTAVQAGDNLAVRVGRTPQGALEMQLAGQRAAPALKPPPTDLPQLTRESRAGLIRVTVREGRGGQVEIQVGSRTYSPAELGVRADSLPRGSWSARIEGGRLLPQQELAAQLGRVPPSLTPQSSNAQEAIAAASRTSSGNLLIRVRDTAQGTEIQLAGRSFTPQEMGVRPADLPRGAWMARVTASGSNLTLPPANSDAAQLRQVAGQLAVSGDPLALQAAVELAESQSGAAGTYSETGETEATGGGIPWLTLPGGQTTAIQMGGGRLTDESQGAARIEIWGNRLGPVAINFLRTPAGTQIGIAADPEVVDRLKGASGQLAERVRQATGSPAAVTVVGHQERPLPPEGFESYG